MSAPLLLLALSLAGTPSDTTLRLPRNGVVQVETQMRSVILRIGTSDVVTVKGAQANLDGGTLSVDDDFGHGHTNAPIEIVVPSWARVDISSVGGNLTFTGTPERLHAETVNGFIHASGGTGTLELEAIEGDIVVTDFRGTTLSIDAIGGAVAVTNAIGTINVENVNGSITLKGIRSNSVSANTVNDAIAFEGNFAAGGHYEFSSQNDDVTLTLPADVSARMTISTVNGELISPQIPATTGGLTDRNRARNRDRTNSKDKDKDKDEDERTFTVVYGSGAARVTIDVFNGNVRVKKKP